MVMICACLIGFMPVPYPNPLNIHGICFFSCKVIIRERVFPNRVWLL